MSITKAEFTLSGHAHISLRLKAWGNYTHKKFLVAGFENREGRVIKECGKPVGAEGDPSCTMARN